MSASSPFVEGVFTYLHSARTQIFTRMFPRCGIPDWFEGWDDWEQYVRFLYETGSITEHTQMWWSVRPHLQFPTVEIRICDAQPDLAEARSLAALIYSLTARIARALDEGEPLPSWPHRLLEENLWRAIRHGLSGELIDLERGESIPARARLEQLVEWVQPVADELGAAPWLAIPERNAAERQIARHDEGASMQEIFAEQVAAGERVTRLSRRAEQLVEELQKVKVGGPARAHELDSRLARVRQARARDPRPRGRAARDRGAARASAGLAGRASLGHPAGRLEPPARLRRRRRLSSPRGSSAPTARCSST